MKKILHPFLIGSVGVQASNGSLLIIGEDQVREYANALTELANELERTVRDDSDVVEVMIILRELKLTLHVRGSDEHPVVEFRHKKSRRVVGGIELKRLMLERAKAVSK